MEQEVEPLFGPCNNKNGYRYYFSEDVEVIKRVEEIWMIVHQRPQVPINHLINKVEARGIVYERKGKKVNCTIFIEWTI
jgi:hypothetical protein